MLHQINALNIIHVWIVILTPIVAGAMKSASLQAHPVRPVIQCIIMSMLITSVAEDNWYANLNLCNATKQCAFYHHQHQIIFNPILLNNPQYCEANISFTGTQKIEFEFCKVST